MTVTLTRDCHTERRRINSTNRQHITRRQLMGLLFVGVSCVYTPLFFSLCQCPSPCWLPRYRYRFVSLLCQLHRRRAATHMIVLDDRRTHAVRVSWCLHHSPPPCCMPPLLTCRCHFDLSTLFFFFFLLCWFSFPFWVVGSCLNQTTRKRKQTKKRQKKELDKFTIRKNNATKSERKNFKLERQREKKRRQHPQREKQGQQEGHTSANKHTHADLNNC